MKIDNYKEMLDLILNHSHEGVVLCDSQGKIRYFNRILGIADAEMEKLKAEGII